MCPGRRKWPCNAGQGRGLVRREKQGDHCQSQGRGRVWVLDVANDKRQRSAWREKAQCKCGWHGMEFRWWHFQIARRVKLFGEEISSGHGSDQKKARASMEGHVSTRHVSG